MTESVTIDLVNYRDRVGARLPAGRYRVSVEDAEKDQSRNGNQMINVWFRVQGGDHDGATIVDRLVLTEKSMFRVVGFLQAVGIPTPKKKFSLNLANVTGKVLEIDIEDGEPYNGRVKSEVRGYVKITKAAGDDDLGATEAVAEAAAAENADDAVDLDDLKL